MIFGNTLNTRSILENNLKFIRSDVPTVVTEEERIWLIERNITVIVDLRTDEEGIKKECPLKNDKRFEYLHMPVTGGNVVPPSVNEVSTSYINMVDEQMYRIIESIWCSQSNVLYFCNVGKDRTGIVSAILLYKLGMDIDYIVYDYIKSNNNIKNMLDAFAQQNPTIDIDVITPHERYMKEFMEWFAIKVKSNLWI